MPQFRVAILALLVFSGCGKRSVVPAVVSAPPSSGVSTRIELDVPEHFRLFEQGLAAFREFTPEGYERSVGLFRRASVLAPDNCEYRLHVAQSNLFLAFEEASNLEDFSPAFNQSEPPACGEDSAFMLRLEAFRSLGIFRTGRDRRESSSQINQALELEPENELNWFVSWELGMNAERQRNPIAQDPGQPADLAIIQNSRGQYWFFRADFEKARQAFEKAIDLSPRHFRSYMGLAGAISAVNPDEDVEPYYKRAVEIAPNNLLARTSLGDYYAWIAETTLAEEQYLAAIKQNPSYVPAYLGLGQNYLNERSLDGAEKALLRAIEIAPNSHVAHYYLGNVWLERDNFDKAREQYQAALSLVPVYPEALYGLGMVFGEKGEFDPALEQFEKVLSVSPRHAGAYFWRAVILADRKQFGSAVADCTRAIGLYDEQGYVLAKSIDNAEKHGHERRAAAERRKKEQLEATRQRVLELHERLRMQAR